MVVSSFQVMQKVVGFKELSSQTLGSSFQDMHEVVRFVELSSQNGVSDVVCFDCTQLPLPLYFQSAHVQHVREFRSHFGSSVSRLTFVCVAPLAREQ